MSGARAFAMAGVTHADIDVAKIYDAFTITPILALEALGFCQRGEGGAFVSNQRTAPGGDFPMNTNGGGLSYTHTGMYGIFTIIEAVRQLRGECGARQVTGAKTAICHGTGGVWSAAATMIVRRRSLDRSDAGAGAAGCRAPIAKRPCGGARAVRLSTRSMSTPNCWVPWWRRAVPTAAWSFVVENGASSSLMRSARFDGLLSRRFDVDQRDRASKP